MHASPSSSWGSAAPVFLLYSSMCYFMYSCCWDGVIPIIFFLSGHIDKLLRSFFCSLVGSGLLTIASPTSARFKEPTSFVPSPHINVKWPSWLSMPTIIPFWAGEVLEKISICRIVGAASSFNSMTVSSTSPLMQSMCCRESLKTSCCEFVVAIFLSSISFQMMRPSRLASDAKADGPLPKVNYWPMKAAVSALSPVIILTSWEEAFSSLITERVSCFKGHSAMMKPAKSKSYSASSLV